VKSPGAIQVAITKRQRMSQREEREENQVWKTKRDALVNAMWQEYQACGVS